MRAFERGAARNKRAIPTTNLAEPQHKAAVSQDRVTGSNLRAKKRKSPHSTGAHGKASAPCYGPEGSAG